MTQTHKTRLDRLELQQVQGAQAPGSIIHHIDGGYALELDGESWPSLEALHRANLGRNFSNAVIIRWVQGTA